ncbi:MAG: hypothetical protein KJ052_20580 [Candidatus Hydrogenedentes bacterium]|nr:hypothetical protein [Candidatus Hydrogenedentota bacterium]
MESTPSACSAVELSKKLAQEEDFLLLDLRTDEELEIVQVAGACQIPLHTLADRLGELAPWRDKEIVAMCHHGVRSAAAQEYLLAVDFKNVRNLDGGIDAYAAEVDPTLARY